MDFVRSHFGKMQLWIVEHFFLWKNVPVLMNHNIWKNHMFWFITTGTFLWRKKCSTSQSCIFPNDFLKNPYFSIVFSQVYRVTMIKILISLLSLIFFLLLLSFFFVYYFERKKQKQIKRAINHKMNTIEAKINNYVLELANVSSTRLISKHLFHIMIVSSVFLYSMQK